MKTAQAQVREFMQAFGQGCPTEPKTVNFDIKKFRTGLISEEAHEYLISEDMEEIADAIGDLLYVVIGAAVAHGIDIEPIFAEIHRSNMSKMWDGHEVLFDLSFGPERDSFRYFDANGNLFEVTVKCPEGKTVFDIKGPDKRCYIVKRASDGKVIKSPSYSPANLKPILEAQMKGAS